MIKAARVAQCIADAKRVDFTARESLNIAKVFLLDNLEQALRWAKKQRKNYPDSDEIWSLSLRWSEEKPRIFEAVLQGAYRFEPVRIRRHDSGKTTYLWHARDAVVLKALTMGLTETLRPMISKQCTHLKGHGSIPRAVQSAHDAGKCYTFVFKSDIKSYYESINHTILLHQFRELNADLALISFLRIFLEHTEQYGGIYLTMTKGISKACPLSPLLGALYLAPLDKAMAKLPVKYIRYMDDWLVFTRTRGQLRRVVKTAHVVLSQLKLIKHPDKTFIGRLSRTFEFCGFRFSTNGVVALAKATLNNHTQTQSKLYEHEQGASVKHKKYQAGFLAWVRGVLGAAVLRELLTRPMSEWCPRSATQRRAAVEDECYGDITHGITTLQTWVALQIF